MKKIFTLLLVSALAVSALSAQKFGYVNTALLLQEMPEVQAANSELETYQQQLMADGQTKVKQFEQKVAQYQQQASNGELSQKQIAEKEQELAAEQQSLAQLEQEVQQKILIKREELLSPILQKVDVAIQAIGKEGGYTFIFDASVQGAMLYAPEGDDLIDQVRSKMAGQ